MWVESSLQVGDQPFEIRVERLDDERRERTAALLAWSTLEALRNAESAKDDWQELVNQLLSRHVSFSIPVASLERLGPTWWEEALGRALSQFVLHNGLAPRINRHLEAIRSIDCPGHRES